MFMQSHHDFTTQLRERMDEGSSPITVLEGFVGVGKSSLVRNVVKTWSGTAITVYAAEGSLLEDLLLEVAANLEGAGIQFPNVGDPLQNLTTTILQTLKSHELLLVLDDFDLLLDHTTQRVQRDFENFLLDVSKLNAPGRLIVVTNRTIARASWLDRSSTMTLGAPSTSDAKRFLEEQLQSRNCLDDVPEELLEDICEWLGSNPGAIRAFVSALVDNSLEELIELDPEGWDLRGQRDENRFLQDLLEAFWSKSIGQLDSKPLRLVQDLSVLRKPFTIDTIRDIFAEPGDVSGWRMDLTRRFILEKSQGKFLQLNAVVRQLAASDLQRSERQYRSAHNRAARHYTKRVQGGTDRDLLRAGKAFVEARFHFSRAKATTELDDLASHFRRLSRSLFRSSSVNLENSDAVEEMTPILLAVALTEQDALPDLRTTLARLLLARDHPGDRRLALNQALVASTSSRNLALWRLLLDLLDEFESDATIQDAVRRAARVFPTGLADVADAAAAKLHKRANSRLALEVISFALQGEDAEKAVALTTTRALLLDRTGHGVEAVQELDASYSHLQASPTAYRLFEEAAFLALQHENVAALRNLRRFATGTSERDEHRATLLDVLESVMRGDFSAVLQRAKVSYKYPAVAAQAAFAALVLGDRSIEDLARVNLGPSNQFTTVWLEALVMHALRRDDEAARLAGDLAQRLNTPPTTATTVSDILVLAWDHVPDWKGSYPAFYFPVLPTDLTGLSYSLKRTAFEGSVLPLGESESVTWPQLLSTPATPAPDTTPSNLTQIKIDRLYQMSDQYVNNGNAAAMGNHAKGKVENQNLGSNFDLAKVRSSILEIRHAAPESSSARDALDGAVVAADQGDVEGTRSRLKDAGGWLLDKVGDVTVGVTAALLLKFIGVGG